jgi:S1-C subfamily serine protease
MQARKPNRVVNLAIRVMRREDFEVKLLEPKFEFRGSEFENWSNQMANAWQELSKGITEAIDRTGESIVAVDGRAGHTSSGIVWRTDFVVTASHSIRQEVGICVLLGGERVVKAHVAGRDRGADLALLKLDQEVAAPPAEFGTTAALSVGDFTVAVARTRRGNLVASTGIVSGLMGEWKLQRTRIDQFIRPDLVLYPGFSGGALVGSEGKILGLNTSGLLRGTPITIPSSTVTRIAEVIAAAGNVAQPYLGLVLQPVQISETLQTSAGVNATTGLLAMHVQAGAAADAAGMFVGDILLEIEGKTLGDLGDLHDVMDNKGVGQEVAVTLLRGGKVVRSTIKLGARP